MARNTKYKMQAIDTPVITKSDLPGINVPQINWKPAIAQKDKPEDSATVGAEFGVNISGGGSGDGQVSNNGYLSNLSVDKLTAGTITSKSITLAVSDGDGDAKIQAGKTDFDNTENGFILGIDDSDSNRAKFLIGDSKSFFNFIGSNGVDDAVVEIQATIKSQVGDILLYSLNTERSTTQTTYTLIKSVKITRAGAYRIAFGLRSQGGQDVAGQIFRNRGGSSSAVGTERTTNQTTPLVEWSEDIYDFEADDNIELKIKNVSPSANNAIGGNFNIYVLNYDNPSTVYDA